MQTSPNKRGGHETVKSLHGLQACFRATSRTYRHADESSPATATPVFYLRRLSLLAGLSSERLALLSMVCTMSNPSARTEFTTPSDHVLLVHGGRVYLMLAEGEGALDWGEAGDVLGLAHASSAARPPTFRTPATSLVSTAPLEALRELAGPAPIVDSLTRSAQRLAERIEFARHPVARRLAHLLVGLGHGATTREGCRLRLKQYELGWRIGASRETCAAMLGKFETVGLLFRERRGLIIADRNRLARLADGSTTLDGLLDVEN